MLCYGALWVGRKHPDAWRPWYDAALALAQRRGWNDVVAAMEDMRVRAGLEPRADALGS